MICNISSMLQNPALVNKYLEALTGDDAYYYLSLLACVVDYSRSTTSSLSTDQLVSTITTERLHGDAPNCSNIYKLCAMF